MIEDSSSQPSKRPYEASYTIDLSIAEFMRSKFSEGIPYVDSVIVIAGSALYAQATTCADYISTTWPKSGSFVVEILDAILAVLIISR
jgi:hypothetical protein